MHTRGWGCPPALYGAKEPLESSLPYAWPTLRLYACWLATAVPCRQRAAQLPLWSHNGGGTAATVGRGGSRGSHPSYAYTRAEPSCRPVWRKDASSIVFIVRLDHNASMCSLARDGRTTPSVSSTVAVVESQRRGDRWHDGPRSLMGGSPFACISEGRTPLSTSSIAATYSMLDP